MSGDAPDVQDLLRRMEPVAVTGEEHAAAVAVYRALADAAFRGTAPHTCALVVDGQRAPCPRRSPRCSSGPQRCSRRATPSRWCP
jgi:hypothetical protein